MLRSTVPALCAAAVAAAATGLPAATVWSGGTANDLTFTMAAGADSTLPENQDRLTGNVWLTRGLVRGIYNAKTEQIYTKVLSPEGTLWAFSSLGGNPTFTYGTGATNFSSLTFTDWETSLGGAINLKPNILAHPGVIYLQADDIYVDVQFLIWDISSGFSYKRGVAAPSPITTTWNGGGGTWSSATNWSNGVPNNGTPAGARYRATINTGVATLDVTAAVDRLTIGGTTDSWTGTLDLTTNALIIASANASEKDAAISTLQNQIASGRAAGAWNGTGITSSSILSTPDSTLALADNADLNLTSFRGKAVDGNSLILAMAHLGDGNLDGKVNAFDLNLLAAHWQQAAGALWSAGDFNGDGSVNAFDLNLLAAQWQFGAAETLTAAPQTAAIPEPATALSLALGALLLLRRRSFPQQAHSGADAPVGPRQRIA